MFSFKSISVSKAYTAIVAAAVTMAKTVMLKLATSTNNKDANVTFLDESNNFFGPITANGDVIHNSYSPYGSDWSWYFDGSGDYLSLPSSSSFTLGTGNFTIEAWINRTGINPINPTYGCILADFRTAEPSTQILIDLVGSDPKLRLWVNGAVRILGSSNMNLNEWNHFAVVRNNGITKLYVNGVQEGADYTDANNYSASTLKVGGRFAVVAADGDFRSWPGFISNFRMIKGTAIYTTNFTPPTSALTAVDGTTLLACQNSYNVDNSLIRNTITVSGNTASVKYSPFISTEIQTVPTASVYFDGNGDYLTVPSNDSLQFGTGDFTIELWFNPGTLASHQPLMYHTSNREVNGTGHYALVFNSTLGLRFFINNGTTVISQNSTAGWTPNTWYHIAAVRSGNTLTLYRNGDSLASGSVTGITIGAAVTTQVGGETYDPLYSTGYISNVRVVKGTALYTSAFTPSTTPLTAVSGTALLTCQGTSFADSSTNNHTITATGNARAAANSPFSTTSTTETLQTTSSRSYATSSSVYFDGSGDYLTIADNTALDMEGSSFTIEYWYYPLTTPSAQTIFAKRASGSGGGSYAGVLQGFSNNSLFPNVLATVNGSSWGVNLTSTVAVTLNSWNHIAVVRDGNTWQVYVNGVSGGSAVLSGTVPNNTAAFTIGGGAADGSFAINNSAISNFRVVKGTAVYTSNFTPPTSPLTAISGTTLLTCQGTTLTDASTNNFTITAVGNAAINSNNPFAPTLVSQPITPVRSVFFDGTGDYLSLADGNTAVQFGSGDFTVEGWIFNTSSVNPGRVVNNWSSSTAGAASWEILVAPSSLIFLCGTNGTSSQVSLSGTIGLNQWYHFAGVRSGNVFTLYINGVSVGTTTQNITLQAGNTFTIGARRNSASYVEPFPGYISNLRVVKGTAVYTSNFTPPTTGLTAISGTSLLTCVDGTFKDRSANNFAITQAGDAKTTQFSPYTPIGALSFDGNGDYLTVPDNDAFNFSDGNFTVEFWLNPNSIGTSWIVNQFEGSAGVDTNSAFTFLFTAASKLQATVAYGNSTTQINLVSTTTILVGSWYHAALVRNDSSLTLYLNGVPEATSSALTTSVINNSNLNVNIGQRQGGANYYNGYLSNIRIVKGTAVYTTRFIPSTADLTPISGTSLLIVGRQNFLDTSNNNFAVSAFGNAAVTTSVTGYPIGSNAETYSVNFPGSSSMTTASSTAAEFGTGDFTMEGWFYISSNVANYVYLFESIRSSTGVGFRFGDTGFGFKLQFYTDFATSANIYSTPILQTTILNRWTHIALSRAGGVLRFFVNGKMQTFGSGINPTTYTSAQIADAVNITAGTFRVGSGLNGYATGVRSIKARALYTENFTPPTDKLTAVPGTTFLVCQSNRLMDDSPSALAISTTGSPAVSTSFSPYHRLYSWYLGGTNEHAIINHSSALSILSGDFTAECWFQPEVIAGYKVIVGQWRQAAGSEGWMIGLSTNTPVFHFGAFNAATALLTSSTTVKNGEWNHIAITRNGSAFTMYLNGVSVATATSSVTRSYVAVNTTVGNYYNSGGTIGAATAVYYKGYVSNIRILKGVVAYTSAFTPRTAPLLTSAYPRNTSLLTAQSAAVVDNSPNNLSVTLVNAARVDPSTPFAATATSTTTGTNNLLLAGSAYFDGTGDYLSVPANAAFYPAANEDFTIEFWWRPQTLPASATAILTSGWTGSNYIAYLFYWNNTSNAISFYSSSNGSSWDIANNQAIVSAPKINQWYHIAASRRNGIIRLFANGVLSNTISSAVAPYSAVQSAIAIGAGGTGSNATTGHISSVRIIRGAGLYEGNFRPGAEPLVESSATSLGLDFRHFGMFDATGKNILRAFGNAAVTTVQKRDGNNSISFDGNGDYLLTGTSSNFDLYGGDFTVECWVYLNSIANTPHILQIGTDTNSRWSVYLGNNAGTFRLYSVTAAGNGNNRIISTAKTTDTWYHLAIVKSSSTITMYINGTSEGTTTSNIFPTGNQQLAIGWQPFGGLSTDYLNGYIQGLKVTTEALYTGNFTPV